MPTDNGGPIGCIYRGSTVLCEDKANSTLIYLSLFLTGYEPGLNALSIDQHLSAVSTPCLASSPCTYTFEPRRSLRYIANMESTKYTCKHRATNLLNPKNYRSWKNALTIFLRPENALQMVLGNEQPPPSKATRRQCTLESQCCALPVNANKSLCDVIYGLPDQHLTQIWALFDE